MTWWIAAYFILYCGLFLFSLWDDIVTDEPLWYVAMDGLADVAAILFILGRAYMPAEAQVGPQWLAMFVYSLVWIVASAPHELRKNNVNTDLSDRENAAALAFGFLLVIVLCAPAYYWGLQLAWRYLQGR